MNHQRIIEFVGGSEEETAYLRLLLRKAAARLRERWRLRREDDGNVDLVVIHDVSELASTLGASASSQRRVRLIDSVLGAAGMQTCAWPPSPDEVVRLLNATTMASEIAPATIVPAIQQNVYDDLFESSLAERWQIGESFDAQAPLQDFDDKWQPPPRLQESTLMAQAEQLFRREPDPVHKDVLASIRLHDRVSIEATDGTTSRGGARAASSMSDDEANQSHPLATYLTGRLLSGPSRIEACHVVLTLDPRNRSYYAKGALCVFEDCCRHPLRRADWKALSAREFSDIKASFPARPYAELQWLCAYLDDPGAGLDSEFSADSRYRMIQSIDLQRDYPAAACLARELDQRSTLGAAAVAAGVSLGTAQRIAAAFDAVGCLIPD